MEKTEEIETQATHTTETTNEKDEKQSETAPIEIQDPIDPYKEFSIQRDYINMKSVEQEKLAWMKDVPKIEMSKVCWFLIGYFCHPLE